MVIFMTPGPHEKTTLVFVRMKISRRGYLPDIFTYGSALAASRVGGWQRPLVNSKLWVASFQGVFFLEVFLVVLFLLGGGILRE